VLHKQIDEEELHGGDGGEVGEIESITLLSEIDQLVRQRKIDQRRTQPTVRYDR